MAKLGKGQGAPRGNRNAAGSHLGTGRRLNAIRQGVNAGLSIQNGAVIGAISGGKLGSVMGPHGMIAGAVIGAGSGLAIYHGLEKVDHMKIPKKWKLRK